eukprot:6192680-Pleurochrysis_carterae.AAC.2
MERRQRERVKPRTATRSERVRGIVHDWRKVSNWKPPMCPKRLRRECELYRTTSSGWLHG